MRGDVFLGGGERDGFVSFYAFESLFGDGGTFLAIIFLGIFPKVDELGLVMDGALDFVGGRMGAAGGDSRYELTGLRKV